MMWPGSSARKGLRAKYIVGFDGTNHVLLRDHELVIEGTCITYLGLKYPGSDVEWADVGNALVVPGFISVHSHPIFSPIGRSLREEPGGPPAYRELDFWIHLYDLIETHSEVQALCQYAVWDLLRRGCTTAVFMTVPEPAILAQVLRQSGMTGYVAPAYREATWIRDGGSHRSYRWDPSRGQAEFQKSIRFIETYHESDGRIKGMLAPEQLDTCSRELLEMTARRAQELDVLVTTHAAQSMGEFNHIRAAFGVTPIQLLDEVGLLSTDLIIAHCVYHSRHSSVEVSGVSSDLELLASRGASVAHCPWVLARRGQVLEFLGRYRRAGVNVALGTDVCPQDPIQEMRWAMVAARIGERASDACSGVEALNAATLGGAQALGRTDIGRLAEGCLADLCILDLSALDLQPVYDPIRTLLYSAHGGHVKTVVAHGNVVVDDGRVLTIREDQLLEDVTRVSQQIWARLPQISGGLSPETVAPFLLGGGQVTEQYS